MDNLDLLFRVILGIGVLFIIINVIHIFILRGKSSLIINSITFIFIEFLGFFNYGLTPLNYPNRRLFCILTSLLYLIIFCGLNIKKDLVKPIYIKAITILIIVFNLLTLIYFNMNQY